MEPNGNHLVWLFALPFADCSLATRAPMRMFTRYELTKNHQDARIGAEIPLVRQEAAWTKKFKTQDRR